MPPPTGKTVAEVVAIPPLAGGTAPTTVATVSPADGAFKTEKTK
ncbi:hypothetical protein [Parabacteroides sp. AF17-3]|nr:hypothetical protein [Parabacteroides sp. AF17-3]